MAHTFSHDAIMTLAIIGRETQRIGLGTAVVPTYPRHPTAIAQQAITAGAASGGRFSLGIGLSHKLVIEDMLGMSYAKPARHMREYLSVLAPLLRGEAVDFGGEEYRVKLGLDVPDACTVPLIVAALGPKLLEIAGELADGTTTWMTGPKTLEEHIIPSISKAAHQAGRKPPTVVGGFPVALTANVDAAKEKIAKKLAMYGMLPSYRAMMEREGAEGPQDIAMLGDEKSLRAQIERLRAIGVTDFNAAVLNVEQGAFERTVEFLAAL
jgi:F420-dependent oxidoreductase-like protein